MSYYDSPKQSGASPKKHRKTWLTPNKGDVTLKSVIDQSQTLSSTSRPRVSNNVGQASFTHLLQVQHSPSESKSLNELPRTTTASHRNRRQWRKSDEVSKEISKMIYENRTSPDPSEPSSLSSTLSLNNYTQPPSFPQNYDHLKEVLEKSAAERQQRRLSAHNNNNSTIKKSRPATIHAKRTSTPSQSPFVPQEEYIEIPRKPKTAKQASPSIVHYSSPSVIPNQVQNVVHKDTPFRQTLDLSNIHSPQPASSEQQGYHLSPLSSPDRYRAYYNANNQYVIDTAFNKGPDTETIRKEFKVNDKKQPKGLITFPLPEDVVDALFPYAAPKQTSPSYSGIVVNKSIGYSPSKGSKSSPQRVSVNMQAYQQFLEMNNQPAYQQKTSPSQHNPSNQQYPMESHSRQPIESYPRGPVLSQSDLYKFKLITWGYNESESESNDTICAMCTDPFMVNDKLRVAPCKHMFHHECLVKYFKNKKFCPTCRTYYGS